MGRWVTCLIVVAALTILDLAHSDDTEVGPSGKDRPQSMVGYWYGEIDLSSFMDLDKIQKWIVVRHANGDTAMHMKVYNNDGSLYLEQIEIGEWWVEDDDYIAKITTILRGNREIRPDTPEGFYLERYHIDELTGESFTYTHIDREITFTVKRVEQDFVF